MDASLADWLVAQWTSRFSEILLTMADLQPKIHVQQAGSGALAEGSLWWRQPFSCCEDAPVWIGAEPEAWNSIGKLVLDAAGVENAPESEIQSTFFEILRQSMSSLATDIGQRIGNQVTCGKGSEAAPETAGMTAFRLDVEISNRTLQFSLAITDQFCRAIAAASSTAVEPAANGGQASLPSDVTPESRTFELLLDVEMPVTVSFGRATLKLQDAVKLITGSMIELDRGLNDPVELLVNNSVIARGEVVVIEGNYGVRITEIVTQKERLKQTRRYMLQ